MAPRDIHIDLGNQQAPQRRAAMTPQERAQRDAAYLGAQVSDWLLWPIGLASLVSLGFNLNFAIDLARTPAMMLAMTASAVVITAMILILPMQAQSVERSYPQHARVMRIFWACSVAVAILAVIFHFASDKGRTPQDLGAMLLSLTTATICGQLLCWRTLGTSESYRFAHGDVGPTSAAVAAAPLPQIEHAGYATAEDMFHMWADGRLIPDVSGKVSPTDACADFFATCELNGIQPPSSAKFFDLLKGLANSSDGKIRKAKIEGKHYYVGWAMPTTLQEVGVETFQRIAAPRTR